MEAPASLSELRNRLKGAAVPAHMAVIPDGNRRWAGEQGLSPIEGHRRGFDVAKRLGRFCREIGIHTTTVWAFSTENWRRHPSEVKALMVFYEEWISDLLPEAIEEEARLIHIGRREGLPREVEAEAGLAGFSEGLPQSLRRVIEEAEAKTASFDRYVINLAINYGGADEIHRAVGRLFEHAGATGADPASLDLADFLDTAGQPHPNADMVWRTSGEFRSSGFLPLQSAYAEMVFSPKYFPDVTEEDVVEAILEYSARVRRFGG
ncbi:MAG: polyprenyl diphosphate synthase [Actinomycetota bacterium]